MISAPLIVTLDPAGLSAATPEHALFLEWAGLPAKYLAALARDWKCQALTDDAGSLIGIGIVNGTELHFAAAPGARGRVCSRRNIKTFLAPLLERRGFLTTRVHTSTSAAFIERLGFVKTREDDFIHYYMLTGLPYARTEN